MTTKRIALFLDGTWNNLDDNTNVWRMKCLCKQSADQIVYYSAGVGTARGEKITGGAFGIGINEEVEAAYEWLMDNYEADSQIFIFGFSRGAFTARSLAGFISKCGLLRSGSPLSMSQLYERYRKGDAPSIRELAHEDCESLEDRWLKKYSRPIPIWFQGVWDTVGSLGVPIPGLPKVSHHAFDFLEVDLRINDTHAFHALAIDEHRGAFKPTLWVKATSPGEPGPPERDIAHVEQRWFVGAHANVGGGYPNDILAQPPLKWLMEKAIAHKLEFKESIDVDDELYTCAINDSYLEMGYGLYAIATLGQKLEREIGADPKEIDGHTVHTINESIDASVFERWRRDAEYRPKNLQEWAKRKKVDPAQLMTSVLAADPAVIAI